MGAPGTSTTPGAAYLVYGSGARLTHQYLGGFAHFTGEGINNQAGYAVAGSGDTDGDGFDDVLLGAPNRGDCDDYDPGVRPGATETCNGIDDDCDLLADDTVVRRRGGLA